MGLFTAIRLDAYPSQPFAALPTDTAFSLRVAGALAWAAQLAYEVLTPDKFSQVLRQWQWTNPQTIQAADSPVVGSSRTKGFAATWSDCTIIAFAGTEPNQFSDWKEDFTILRDGRGAHEGFENGLDAVWTTVERIARESAPGGLYLTGHSLGGALAGVAARRLIDQRIIDADRIKGVYTIGMPRIGDADYAQAYDAAGGQRLGQRTFRLVHGQDIVTKVPPTTLDFAHVGCMLACPRGGRFPAATPTPTIERPGTDELFDAAWSLLDLPIFSTDDGLPAYPSPEHAIAMAVATLPKPIRDHLPDRYLAALPALN
ncbi:MAG TPA: lipase family protein [Acetobacteraceae bacterium]|nr:lipase family protein [Acetobacteraceae bacterium]